MRAHRVLIAIVIGCALVAAFALPAAAQWISHPQLILTIVEGDFPAMRK